MPDPTLKLVIFAALLLHGISHVGALGALIWIRYSPGPNTGGWLPARSSLFPLLSPSTASTVASIFWIVSLLGFVLVALSFWGILIPGDMWRPLAVVSAVVSIIGIALFFGTWPAFNTAAALGMDVVAVLVALLWPL
jgi:hypothetical protein